MFRGYEVGAVDYLMKPVVPEVLKSKVAVFVELFRKSERLRESEDKLRRLAAHLISVREEERAHIAREIHDELGQVLTGLKMEVTWLAKRLKDKVLIEKTDSMCGADRLHGADGAQDRHRPAPRDARRHGPDRRGRAGRRRSSRSAPASAAGPSCRPRSSSTSTSRPRCSASSRRS